MKAHDVKKKIRAVDDDTSLTLEIPNFDSQTDLENEIDVNEIQYDFINKVVHVKKVVVNKNQVRRLQ